MNFDVPTKILIFILKLNIESIVEPIETGTVTFTFVMADRMRDVRWHETDDTNSVILLACLVQTTTTTAANIHGQGTNESKIRCEISYTDEMKQLKIENLFGV